jgi:glycosyltransferase involved in cell wall biosynthesis
VLDQHNAVFLVPKRLAESAGGGLRSNVLRREQRLMAEFERETCRRFDDVVWVTDEDLEAVGRVEGPRHHVIPICVDPQAQPVIERVAQPHRVTFLGGLHWPPNAAGISWFAREVWPLVHHAHPQAILTVIGKSPPAELSGIQAVEVTGYVDDPLPYLSETAVFIVPLHAAGGMRVKILDAWAWGLPVASTAIGAEGIAYADGENLLIANDPAGFVEAVGRVLCQPDLEAALAFGGRRTVETAYNWRAVYPAWEALYTGKPNTTEDSESDRHVRDLVHV